MSFDLAIDYTTGDLLNAPNHDIQGRTGPDVYEQRIRVRLKVQRGTWALDPTDGDLGSRLHELTRVQSARALVEIEQYVREALEPMRDITVRDVQARLSEDTDKILLLDISYQPHIDGDDSDTLQSISLTIPTRGA
jgi:phage gp46-like protein